LNIILLQRITTAALLDAEAAQAATYLEGVAARLREAGMKTSAEVGRGEAIRVLLDTVARQDIDLIVIATHGRSGIGAVWAGSVTSRILRYSPRPILLIRIPGPPPGSE
jgi:nucleotide-binding universal stress UspA family protein